MTRANENMILFFLVAAAPNRMSIPLATVLKGGHANDSRLEWTLVIDGSPGWCGMSA
jgi:hypothetical protein